MTWDVMADWIFQGNPRSSPSIRSTRLLADGNQVPVLGLGVWQVPDGPECVTPVSPA